MNKKLKKLIEEFRQTAEEVVEKDVKVTFTSGGRSSLGEVINTQEKADMFMAMLKHLGNSNK
jgi:hypothetical protein